MAPPASYAARRTRNSVAMILAVAAAAIGLFFLFAILITLLYKGFTAISPQMFIENTPPPGEDGGLLNAIFGSVVMTVLAVVVATPIGPLEHHWSVRLHRDRRAVRTLLGLGRCGVAGPYRPAGDQPHHPGHAGPR